MIIPSFAQFRQMFAPAHVWTAAGGVTAAFSAATKRITPSVAPGFVALGFAAGQRLRVTLSTSNDGWYTIAAVDATYVETVEPLVNEAASATASLMAQACDTDGYPTWPVGNVRLPASGFGDTGSTLMGIPRPWTGTTAAIYVTCNMGADDAVLGVDDYDWYLSQRTDDPARQLLTVTEDLSTWPLSTLSGSIVITPNSVAVSDIGYSWAFPGLLPREYLAPIFTRCHLYVMRRLDGAIQWVDLLQAQIATS
jgi:hypothetical protein